MPLIFSKKGLAASFLIDETTPFNPAKVIYLKEGTELSLTLTMTDVTTAVTTLRRKVEIARFVGESVRARDGVLLVGVDVGVGDWDGDGE